MKFNINQRGQSALEYLMTYGWALVVIVVVVAALVLLVGNPASAGDTCSNPGSGFSLTNADFNSTGNWQIIASNITGRTMRIIDGSATYSPAASGAPAGTVDANLTNNASQLLPGQQSTIYGNPGGGVTAGSRYTTTFTFAYNDGDFDRTVTFNCSGTS